MVGDAAHRVERLERRSGGHQHTRRPARLWKAATAEQQVRGLQHAAVAGFATGLIAAADAQHGRAVGGHLRMLRWVAGWLHISRFIAGASSSGTRSGDAPGTSGSAARRPGPGTS